MWIPIHVTLFSDCLYLGDRNGGRLRLLNVNVPGIDAEIILLRDPERGTGPYNVTPKKCFMCGSVVRKASFSNREGVTIPFRLLNSTVVAF